MAFHIIALSAASIINDDTALANVMRHDLQAYFSAGKSVSLMDIDRQNRIEKLLWSIAFPGFGQILNKKLVKGLLFDTLEVIINVMANLNKAIVFSFDGNIIHAVEMKK